MIATNENFDSVLQTIKNADNLSLDTETTGLRPYHGDKLFAISVGGEFGGIYFSFGLEETALDRAVIPLIYEVIKGKQIAFANAKFDMHFLCKEGFGTDFDPWDVLVVDKCLYNRHLSYSLNSVAERMGLGGKDEGLMEYIKAHKLYDNLEVEGKKSRVKNPRFDLVPFEIVSKYALKDAELTYQVYKAQCLKVRELSKSLSAIKGYPGPFSDLIASERKLTKVLFDIEQRGMELNREYIEKAKKREESRIEEAKKSFLELTGRELVDSNKQLSEIFRANGIVGGVTAKGNASFTDAVLEKIDHPIARVIREFRDATKRLNTYYNNFTYCGDAEGIVRPSIKQTAADTFRFSITDPALQTLNSEDEGDWRVRDSFRARPGYVYVSIDYQAQEYRLTADYAGERELIRQINEGVDVHSATAKMMGVERHAAKVLNFALLYGAAPPKIATMLKVSVEKATELKNLYFSKLTNVSSLITNIKSTIDRRGFIFNFAGRILYFPVIEFEQDGVQKRGNFAYKGPNYIIQSSGSEIMRRALIGVHDFLQNHRSKVVLSIHDEILLEMPEEELSLIPKIREIMVSVYTPKNGLPMSTSVAIGSSWGRLEDIDESALAQRIDVQEKSIVEAKEAPAYDYVYHSTNVHPRNPGSASLRERDVCGTGVEEEHQGSCDGVTVI
jgi:DNA polymerase-1